MLVDFVYLGFNYKFNIMTTHISTIEKNISDAFMKTIADFKKIRIANEEDFRACFYHHMRKFIDKDKDLCMNLSHNVHFVEKVIKPDVFIFRENVYLVAIEMKIDDYAIAGGNEDKKRLKNFSKDISKGIYIHIDKTRKRYSYVKQKWHNNYYTELYYIADEDTAGIYSVKKGIKTHNEVPLA